MGNGNLLVGMGMVNKVFEITPDKHLVWSALIERRNPYDTTWMPCPSFKVHYTSSIYPCYFTVQTNVDTLHKHSDSFELKVFNDGTENDAYLVNVASTSGSYQKQFTTPVISPKKNVPFEISSKKHMGKNDIIEITVQSKTNPVFKRTVYVYCTN